MLYYYNNSQPVWDWQNDADIAAHIRGLISDHADVFRSQIIAYLNTNCTHVSRGVVRDSLNSARIAGSGSLYTDHLYLWSDELIYYVREYNLRLPDNFRNHILATYKARQQRHALARLTCGVRIVHNTGDGHLYSVTINGNTGAVHYLSALPAGEAMLMVPVPAIDYFLHEQLEDDYCYAPSMHIFRDTDTHYCALDFVNRTGQDRSICAQFSSPGSANARIFSRVLSAVEKLTGFYTGADLII